MQSANNNTYFMFLPLSLYPQISNYTHNFHYWEMYKDDDQQGYILKEMIVF